MNKKKVTVFGSFVVDLTGRGTGLPVPGETIKGSSFKTGPGGKGSNQAVAAHRAGGDITVVTKLGKDPFAQIALDFFENENMRTEYVFIDQEKETGAALIMVDEESGQNQILVVSGAGDNITDRDIENTRQLIEQTDILLLQLEINMDALVKVINIAHEKGKTIILNTAPIQTIPDGLLQRIDIITPNEIEAAELAGMDINNELDAEKAANILREKGVRDVVITMGKQGVYVMTDGRKEMIPSIVVDAIDTTGAGDAFNGGFATALSEGMDIFEAARFGNVAGALSVTKIGTAPSMPFRAEIDKLFSKA